MKPVWKWVIGVIVFLIIALTSAAMYFTSHWKPILETKLKDLVQNSSDSLYTLSYDDLDLNVALGHITLKNLKILPDSTVYKQLEAAKKAPDNQYAIEVNELKIRDVSIRNIVLNKVLDLKRIVLDHPDVRIINTYHSYNDTISNEPKKTLYEKIKDNLTSIKVQDIQLDSINFKYRQVQNGKHQDFTLKKVSLSVHDILIDSTSADDTSRFFHTKMIDVHVPGFEYLTPDGYYKVSFKDLKLNTKDRSILLTQAIYRPTMSKPAFYKKKKQATSYIELSFDTLRFDDFDFISLLNNKQIHSKRAFVKDGKVSIYSDKHYPKYPVIKTGFSPHQQLMKMKTVLGIDTVLVENVDVAYTEMSGKFDREGTITFTDARGTLSNVTNDSALLAKNKWMRADLRAKVMDTGLLKVQFGFDMTSKNGFHTYKGNLAPMSILPFNRIIRPLLNVEVGSGNVKSISFNMQGTDYKNWGEFRFDYNNLKINILKKPGEDNNRRSMKIVSFLVNHFFVNESNPDEKGIHHVGKVDYTRDPHHTFFKTLWQSLLDGIKQCVGLDKERENKLMEAADNVKGKLNSSKSAANSAVDATKGAAKATVNTTKQAAKNTGGFFKRILKKEKEEEIKE